MKVVKQFSTDKYGRKRCRLGKLAVEIHPNKTWIRRYITRWCNLAIQLGTDVYRSDHHQLGMHNIGRTRGRILTVSTSIHWYVAW